MTFEEKLEVAEMLDDMGVDVIESGFPDHLGRRFPGGQRDRPPFQEDAVSSAPACRARIRGHRPLRRSGRLLKRGRVHTVIATSPLHMRVKLNMTPEQVIETSIANVTAPATRSMTTSDGRQRRQHQKARWISSAASSRL